MLKQVKIWQRLEPGYYKNGDWEISQGKRRNWYGPAEWDIWYRDAYAETVFSLKEAKAQLDDKGFDPMKFYRLANNPKVKSS